ncbi:MAG: hypothetical protein LKF88_00985 [Microbacteriaceae bacterium]|nr:hypothetical protein [Microbacteriaceae bacterium]MCI1207081.1 hypothetical protein [Microbacteriaceae bacterium]
MSRQARQQRLRSRHGIQVSQRSGWGMIALGVTPVLALGVALSCLSGAVQGDAAESGTTVQLENPMAAAQPEGSESSFTIRTFEDTTLLNSELEGSLAVGGSLTVQNGGNDYPLLQNVAGNGDYTLPTINDTPVRALVQQLGSTTNANVRAKTTADPATNGVAEIADSSDGKFSAGLDGGTQFTLTGNSTARLLSDASKYEGSSGTGSPSMQLGESSSTTTVNSLFAEDTGTKLLAQSGVWKAPTLSDDQNVSIQLTAGGPNRLTLADLETDGMVKYQNQFRVSGQSETTPLIIHVDANDVQGGGAAASLLRGCR